LNGLFKIGGSREGIFEKAFSPDFIVENSPEVEMHKEE
jgi:hypothetical protein